MLTELGKAWLIAILISIGVVLFAWGLKKAIVRWMVWKIRKEYTTQAPKVETLICDKGHIYPKEAGLRLEDIPGLVDGTVPICPVCWDINYKNAAAIALRDLQDWKDHVGKNASANNS